MSRTSWRPAGIGLIYSTAIHYRQMCARQQQLIVAVIHRHSSLQPPPPTSPAHGRLHECLLLGISTVTTVRKYLQLNMIFRTPCCSSAAFRRPSWFLERLLGGGLKSTLGTCPVCAAKPGKDQTRQVRGFTLRLSPANGL